MKIVKPGEQKLIKALIYGPNGHGKTRFVGTAGQDKRTSPMLMLDFEGGTKTLEGLEIDIAPVRDWSDYNEIYSELSSGKSPYKSLAIDSISETHVFSLLSILEQERLKRTDPDALQQQDYGKATIQMRRLVRHFRDLPLHVFFTALAKDDMEPKVGSIKKPALAGQLSEEVPGMMDVVGYLALTTNDEGETIRALVLGGMAHFRTKCRTAWDASVPDVLSPDPTVTDLLDALKY